MSCARNEERKSTLNMKKRISVAALVGAATVVSGGIGAVPVLGNLGFDKLFILVLIGLEIEANDGFN